MWVNTLTRNGSGAWHSLSFLTGLRRITKEYKIKGRLWKNPTLMMTRSSLKLVISGWENYWNLTLNLKVSNFQINGKCFYIHIVGEKYAKGRRSILWKQQSNKH